MKIKAYTALAVSFVVCVVGISFSIATGFWASESTKTPAKFQNTGIIDGQYRPDDIRGSYTFGEISSLYSVPLEDLTAGFDIDKGEAETFQCKNLETIYADSEEEIGTGSVRMFVAFYLGIPLDLSESTYVTKQGAQIILEKGRPTDEQKTYLEIHTLGETNSKEQSTVETSETPPSSTEPIVTENPIGTEVPVETQSIDVKGSDYLKDLAKNYNIPIDDFASTFEISTLEANNFQVKDIKNKFIDRDVEIGTASVKIFIAFYNGIPYDLGASGAMMTAKGTEIIKTKGKPLPEQIEYLNNHTELQ